MNFVCGVIHYAGEFRIIKCDRGFRFQRRYYDKWRYCIFSSLSLHELDHAELEIATAEDRESITIFLITELFRLGRRIWTVKSKTNKRGYEIVQMMYNQSMRG